MKSGKMIYLKQIGVFLSLVLKDLLKSLTWGWNDKVYTDSTR